jgi:hypothetical protein
LTVVNVVEQLGVDARESMVILGKLGTGLDILKVKVYFPVA